MTVREVIEDSLLLLGVGAVGESVETEVLNISLRQLRRLLSIWAAEGLAVYSKTVDSLIWIGANKSMTIGPTGSLLTAGGSVVTRPIEIFEITALINKLDYTLRRVSFDEYQKIEYKDLTSSIPEVFAYNGTMPDGTLYLNPIPNGNITIRVVSTKDFTTLALSDTFSFPPGYEEAIQYNLAVRLAPIMGMDVSQIIIQQAANTKFIIERANEDSSQMAIDPLVPFGQNNIGTCYKNLIT